MESSIAGPSPKSRQMTFEDSPKCISSQELLAGPVPCVSLDGQTTGPYGPAPVPASRSRRPESKKAKATKDISGQSCSGSSASVALTRSLESRLVQRLDTVGSMEYVQTWKPKTTPSGRSYLERTASGHRTSAKDSTGWPTPQCADSSGNPRSMVNRLKKDRQTRNPDCSGSYKINLKDVVGMTGWPTPKLPRGGPEMQETRDARGAGGMDLQSVVLTTGWNTPRATDGSNGGPNQAGGALPADAAKCVLSAADQQFVKDLEFQEQPATDAALVGWASPSTRDWKDTPGMSDVGVNPDGSLRSRLDQLPRQVHGLITESSTAQTGSRGVLDARFSRWLMGFPAEWDQASPNYQAWCDVQETIVSGVSRATETP